MSRIIGVDPGMTGALALMVNGVIEALIDMPTFDGEVSGRLVAANIELADPDVVVIEHVHSMPKQGVASSFSFGKNYGIVIGAISALSHPLVKIAPQAWKRANGLSGKPKDAARGLAIALWPDQAHQLHLVKHQGRAEAALIARAHLIHERNTNGPITDSEVVAEHL